MCVHLNVVFLQTVDGVLQSLSTGCMQRGEGVGARGEGLGWEGRGEEGRGGEGRGGEARGEGRGGRDEGRGGRRVVSADMYVFRSLIVLDTS